MNVILFFPVEFPANATASLVTSVLEATDASLGKMKVSRFETCHGYRYLIEWRTVPGKQELFVVGIITVLFVRLTREERHTQREWGERERLSLSISLAHSRSLPLSLSLYISIYLSISLSINLYI